jgi:predicted RNase H-like HicB family nuclease
MKYPVVLENGLDGWIVVSCPSIHGCVSQGRTRTEALENIREAITLMLEVAEEEGWEKPLEFLEVTTMDIDVHAHVEVAA